MKAYPYANKLKNLQREQIALALIYLEVHGREVHGKMVANKHGCHSVTLAGGCHSVTLAGN